ncbi:hypothetical protein Fot_52364 [Forsythia ovata]|uniref:Uncharacterized protein n=1 Tax=Forsythia ovata TaxID=205694 RepID=A0ABD1PM06_9LAMI
MEIADSRLRHQMWRLCASWQSAMTSSFASFTQNLRNNSQNHNYQNAQHRFQQPASDFVAVSSVACGTCGSSSKYHTFSPISPLNLRKNTSFLQRIINQRRL